MAKDSHIVQVGKRILELSNLKKILFPDDDIASLNHIKVGLPLPMHYSNGTYGEILNVNLLLNE